MSFTDQKPRIATEQDCKAPWSCGKNGVYFRCGLCGHKFKPGDRWRWVYTNNLGKYGGNPLVCGRCDGEDVIERWKKLVDEWNDGKANKYWWFVKRERMCVDPREVEI